MTGPVVCDASALIAALVGSGPDGEWATGLMMGAELSAPSLLDFECANIIRRHESAGIVSPAEAAQAHEDLIVLPVERWPYELLARTVWRLRHNLSCYDASYVAVAELTGATLITLDRRLAGAPGLGCAIRTPERPR